MRTITGLTLLAFSTVIGLPGEEDTVELKLKTADAADSAAILVGLNGGAFYLPDGDPLDGPPEPAKLGELSNALIDIRQHCHDLEDEVTKLRGELDNSIAQAGELLAQNDGLKAENEALKARVAALEARPAGDTGAVAALRAELGEAGVRQAAAEQALGEAASKLALASRAITEKEAEITKLRGQVAQLAVASVKPAAPAPTAAVDNAAPPPAPAAAPQGAAPPPQGVAAHDPPVTAKMKEATTLGALGALVRDELKATRVEDVAAYLTRHADELPFLASPKGREGDGWHARLTAPRGAAALKLTVGV